MSEQTDTAEQTTTGSTGGCGCGCGGHDAKAPADERAAAPSVAQPLGEGYVAPEPVTTASMETADPSAIAANVMGVLADGTLQVAVPAGGDAPAAGASGVVPGHKAGNVLGLRDVSAAGGGCGCGGHGHGHDHAHGADGEQAAGGCACGAH